MKPFGFLIHGAVGGFSKKVLWLTVVKSNNNPVVPIALYLRAVKKHGVCPIFLKTDCGSENADMAGLQCYLTKNFSSHSYDASLSNQCRENWWSHFRCSFRSFQRISS